MQDPYIQRAALIPMPFLTEIDPRAAIKSSRDPLGYQPIWSAFGRQVVGNLTTVTTSVRNFTTLLLGLYYADEVISRGKLGEEKRVDAFLKFEQLAAYSRYALGDKAETQESPRGLLRVKRRIDEEGRVVISARQEHQILSSQKTYGLWGLFMVASRQSGFVEQGDNRLTPAATEFVESEYLPQLAYGGNHNGNDIIAYLEGERTFDPKDRKKPLGPQLAKLLSTKFSAREVMFYDTALVRGVAPDCNFTFGRQERLWQTIVRLNNGGNAEWLDPFGYPELIEARIDAEQRDDQPLATALDAIRIVEPLLATTGSLFGFLLLRGEAKVETVAKDITGKWGKSLAHLEPAELEPLRDRIVDTTSLDSYTRIGRMAHGLRSGDYTDVIRTAIDLNADVMRGRGGAPWMSIENGRIKVRLREESGNLPEGEDLPHLWQNSYFIHSLKSVGRTLHRYGIQ
jgi:hypothetical protein